MLIRTYLKIQGKRIVDLEHVSLNPSEYFVDITHGDILNKVGDLKDPNYVEGAISIVIDNSHVIDFTNWDYVDQIWAYFLNALEDLLSTGSGEFFFPDQPLHISMEAIENQQIRFIVGQNSKQMDICEFVSVLVDAAESFFRIMEKEYEGIVEYPEELSQVSRIRSQIMQTT